MSALRDDLACTRAQLALLLAVGTPADCKALKPVVLVMRDIFKTSAPLLGLTRIGDWSNVAPEILGRITHITQGDSKEARDARASLGASLSEKAFQQPFSTFVFRARTAFSSARHPQRLDQLLLVLLCTAAGAGEVLGADIAHGLHQCYQSLARDERNHWRPVAEKAPLNVEEIDELLKGSSVSVVRDFLERCRLYLSVEIGAPPEGLRETQQTGDRPANTGASEAGGHRGRARSTSSAHRNERRTQEVSAPSISDAIAVAQLSPLAAKVGIKYQWSTLIPEDLRQVTAKLAALIRGDDLRLAAMAALALISLLLASNPKSTALTPVVQQASDGPLTTVWIDIDRGWIWWLHSAYTDDAALRKNASAPRSAPRWNAIPMPRDLVQFVRNQRGDASGLRTLIEVLNVPFGGESMTMHAVNALLKELGDSAHLAEPTRFATSLGLAILEAIGSDMLAGHAFHFGITAPSALYYFSPRSCWLHWVYGELFEYLGLDEPVSLDGAPERQGAGKYVDAIQLRTEGQRLSHDIVQLSHTVQQWPSDAEGIAAVSELVPRLAAVFQMPIAGRGSEPERITLASVLAGRGLLAMLD